MSLERSDTHGTKPTLALAMGDPAGISPELTARLLALDEVRQQARLIVIGDRRVLQQGACVAAVDPDVETIGPGDPLPNRIDRPVFVDLANLAPETVARGVATREGGRFALANYRLALPSYDDEIGFSSEVVGVDGPASEFNILENVWNARVTSHVRLADVAARMVRPRAA